MNIYVSNLGFNVNDEDLRQLFAQHGEVSSAKIINDKFTGYSRGFAFVEMPNDSEGTIAIDRINNTQVNDRTINAQVAKPREERKQGSYPVRGSFKKY